VLKQGGEAHASPSLFLWEEIGMPQEKKDVLPVYMDKELKKRIEEAGRREHRSASATAALILDMWFKKIHPEVRDVAIGKKRG
jgi:hypothetical protein